MRLSDHDLLQLTEEASKNEVDEKPQDEANALQQPQKQEAAKAYTAFETVDLEWADLKNPGIRLTNTKHTS